MRNSPEELSVLIAAAAHQQHQPPVGRPAQLRVAQVGALRFDQCERFPCFSGVGDQDADLAIFARELRDMAFRFAETAVEFALVVDQSGERRVRSLVPDAACAGQFQG